MGAAAKKKTAKKKPARKRPPARKQGAKPRVRKKAGCRLVGTKQDREEKFAQLIVLGNLEPWQCYQKAGYRCQKRTAQIGAARMLKNASLYGHVQRRIEELRAVAKARAVEAMVLSFNEKREVLAAVVRTPLEKVGPDSPLCAEYRERYGPEGQLLERVVKKVPLQFGISEDNKMMGDYAAEEVKVDHVHKIIEDIMDERDI